MNVPAEAPVMIATFAIDIAPLRLLVLESVGKSVGPRHDRFERPERHSAIPRYGGPPRIPDERPEVHMTMAKIGCQVITR